MVWMTKPLSTMGKVVVMNSGLCVLEGIILMFEKGLFGLELIKK